jgi:invasion protein IalB
MMRALVTTICFLFTLAFAAPALAQATASGQFKDWGTYSYQSDKGKVCYVMSVPKVKEPTNLNHGDIFFFVSQKPGQNVAYEPQFIAGYDLQDKSKVTVKVGDKSYVMFTKGKSAWLQNAAEEPQLVAAMKAGSDMSVEAKSGRGNATHYEFSLSGITDALDSIANCK